MSYQSIPTLRVAALSVASLLILTASAFCQLGEDNPTGVAGQFNGNVTTGCSYDPYTGNATRSVVDLEVAGGVGAYPLAFTRTMNSRYTPGVVVPTPFGKAGNWNHSYGWSIDDAYIAAGRPTAYYVNYPDGRRIMFNDQSAATGDAKFRGPKGIRDRLKQLDPTSPNDCYVFLPDGGKVHFTAVVVTTPSRRFVFTLADITDPYAQKTTITVAGNVTTVKEPAGRTLKITTKVGPAGDTVVDYILGSDGRRADYTYTGVTAGGVSYSELTSVRYFSDPQYDATYTYQSSNVATDSRPLIATCVDPMFDGPMWKIAYDFMPNGLVYGQLWREKHPSGTVVSTLTVVDPVTRRETRGDNPTGAGNPSRTFTYNTYRLKTTTDFKGAVGSQDYDNNYYLASVTDRRGYTTTYSCNALNGNTVHFKYPDVPGSSLPSPPNPATPTMALNYTYGDPSNDDLSNQNPNNPYYLFSVTNGLNFVNKYYRNTSMQIQQISYPDSSTDIFKYNVFGEKTSHTQRDGSVETWQYNAIGQLTSFWDVAHPSTGVATTRYQYDSYGRILATTDARGLTTSFQYNLRGQVTKTTYADNNFAQAVYNPNGTLANTTDELQHTTSYTYDDYKRQWTITTPFPATAVTCYDTATQCTQASIPPDSYSRVDSKPTKIKSAGGRVSLTAYDENLRIVSVTAVGDTHVQSGTMLYTYDANGNQDSITDPNGNITRTYYDRQNRVKAIDDPMINDPVVPHKNTDGHTTTYFYDVGGNKIQERRVDSKICKYTYNQMGKLKTKSGYRDDTFWADTFPDITTYSYDRLGDVLAVVDPVGNEYDYTYDGLKRKLTAKYPVDANGTRRTETWHYDIGNHVDSYTNPAGQVETFTYDNRNRLTNTAWSNNAAPAVTTTYDAVGRPQVTTTSDGTSMAFGYNNAGNKLWEDQTITGQATHRVRTDPDPDGNRQNLIVTTGTSTNYSLTFQYTSRNELWQVSDGSHTFTYQYGDRNGNITQKTSQLQDSTGLSYDPLNRPVLAAQSALNGSALETMNYDYSRRGTLRDVYASGGNIGDAFTYDDSRDQLVGAQYSASGVGGPSPNPQNAARTVSYACGFLDRNGMTVTDATGTKTTTYTKDNLNQYTAISTTGQANQTLSYDTKFNLTQYAGWTYVYDAQNRLTSANTTGHSASFVYDAIGRCVKRVIDGTTTFFTYDTWRPIAEWNSSGVLTATNIYGNGIDEILFVSNQFGQFYYKTDALNNVRFILNSGGTLAEQYSYDAFGTPTIKNSAGTVIASSATGNRFMYKGREYLATLGLYDFRKRMYHPGLGRFLQVDPKGFEGNEKSNLYRFCGHNPLTAVDPMGEDISLDSSDPFTFDDLGFSDPFFGGVDFGALDAPIADVNANYDLGPGYTIGGTSSTSTTQMANMGNEQTKLANPSGNGDQPKDTSAFKTPECSDGRIYTLSVGSKSGMIGNEWWEVSYRTVGVQTVATDQESKPAGWPTSQAAATAAMDSTWGFTAANGKRAEWAGYTFQNPDGSWFYTIAWGESGAVGLNYFGMGPNSIDHGTEAANGPSTINGVKATDAWHIHVVPADAMGIRFSMRDQDIAQRIGGNNYMEDNSGQIWVHGPVPDGMPHDGLRIR